MTCNRNVDTHSWFFSSGKGGDSDGLKTIDPDKR